jgi:hypothetical protein
MLITCKCEHPAIVFDDRDYKVCPVCSRDNTIEDLLIEIKDLDVKIIGLDGVNKSYRRVVNK